MSALLGLAALVCVALAVLSAVAVGLRARRPRPALAALVDLLLAAGLLRLAAGPGWPEVAVAAAAVVGRVLLGPVGLRRSR